jgi:hypothetical protein
MRIFLSIFVVRSYGSPFDTGVLKSRVEVPDAPSQIKPFSREEGFLGPPISQSLQVISDPCKKRTKIGSP